MKGLIVKDIELTKNQGKTLLILAVVIGVLEKSIMDTKALAEKGGAAVVSEEEEFFG